MLKITKWIPENESDKYDGNDLGGMGGWFKDGMRWKDYLENYKEEAWPMLEELRRSILENKIRMTGQEKQDSGQPSVPLWNNNTVTIYSWRGWGDLMAAVWSESENKDYHYMDFYM